MPFQPGNQEAKKGAKAKLITQQLTSALNEAHKEGDRTKMRAVIDAWIANAIGGDQAAINAIADRIDGKPAQESTVTIDDKRDATDWTRDELVAFLNDANAGGDGVAKANGRGAKPDRVH